MGEEQNAHGRRMWGCEEGCSPRNPARAARAGGEAAFVRGRDSRRAQARPLLGTEEWQQPGNPVLSYLGQETDAAWRRKHLKKISAPCASRQEPGGNRGRGAETPRFGPSRGRCSSARPDGITLGCSSGDGGPKGFSPSALLFLLRSTGSRGSKSTG